MTDKPRLIERAFPLKQTSLTSVHEKNVRHGHISTLHIWPARRPLAACRAALLATLLPDPGTSEKRRKLCERIGGTVVEKIERKKMPNGRIVERMKEETQGGVLRWIGTEPKSGGRKKIEQYHSDVAFRESELAWFREEIKKAYGGRAPRVLDPFAGGGAIPLEAMRLGCEATAVDINPVAWFILKCTLEYPQKLAGKTHPLPEFVLNDEDFMIEFFAKAKGYTRAEAMNAFINLGNKLKDPTPVQMTFGSGGNDIKADLAWHVRAWGRWVLNQARKELAPFYPTYADFEPIDRKNPKPYEKPPMRLVPLKDDGTPDIDTLNAEFSKEYLADKRNPRWVAKPAVAYLWARTVVCKHCRSLIPILKTRWLCRKHKKRILLSIVESTPSGIKFSIDYEVPSKGGNAAQKREYDKSIGQGTMTKSGAKCPNCPAMMTKEDLQVEGRSGLLGEIMTTVIVAGQKTKEYRLPSELERSSALKSRDYIKNVFSSLSDGVPEEPIQTNAKGDTWCVNYGIDKFKDIFSERQLVSLGVFSSSIRNAFKTMGKYSISSEQANAISGYLYCCLSRLADRNSEVCTWQVGADKIGHTFTRYALPFTWDFVEVMPWADSSGGFMQAVDWVAKVIVHTCQAEAYSPLSRVHQASAMTQSFRDMDLIVTDPPYYDAIGYGVVMDFFGVWLKRVLSGVIPEVASAVSTLEKPKWNHEVNDGELVDDANRHDGDRIKAKAAYEDGMAMAFAAAHRSLRSEGRMVIVFAHKQPDAWETLVSAIIKSGFVVDASWPIMTERSSRMRSMGSAALSSSIWLVCKKRKKIVRPGWDNKVLEEMRANITERLRNYWDAGIRGPDFVWAATGPALEAYSKHPIVKKANTPGEVMSVGEFLSHVRRMVVDFVVGQVLTGEKDGTDMTVADRMDAPTAYYLLHRHDFGIEGAPAGACILYATACGLSDRDLESSWDLVSHKGSVAKKQGKGKALDPDAETEPEGNGQSGSKIKLKTWAQRKRRTMGYEAPSGRPIPLIDRVHRLMHLWRAGDVHKVDEYLDDNGLRRQELFKRLVQSLIELSNGGSEERSLLESLSNHVQAKGATVSDAQKKLPFGGVDIAQ